MAVVESIPAGRLARYPGGEILFIEDFRSPAFGFWNDGVGGMFRDCDVPFGSLPSLRIDTQGQSSGGATSPGRTANTGGVVAKRRIHDGFAGLFGIDMWFRMTSLNLTTNTYFSMSLYNRDGVNAYHGRVWLDPNGNNAPMVARILDGTQSQAQATDVWAAPAGTTSVLQNGAGTHTYDAPTGRLDRAGGLHHVKLVMDMANKRYVSLRIDGNPKVDLRTYVMDSTASASFAGMHFSVELVASTSTRRFVNIAQVIGTAE
jgi:hypothetical protein